MILKTIQLLCSANATIQEYLVFNHSQTEENNEVGYHPAGNVTDDRSKLKRGSIYWAVYVFFFNMGITRIGTSLPTLSTSPNIYSQTGREGIAW